MDALRASVQSLYTYKENNFADPGEKVTRITSLIASILLLVDQVPATTAGEKGEVQFLRGRALDAALEYSEEAEECLSRAVRLDPGSADAWAALGHCQWKKGDLESARECYNTSVQQCPTSFALRSLSQLVRNGPLANPRVAYGESIAHAKAAVALDTRDADNWACLGISHLMHYTNIDPNEEDLRNAQRAFNLAVKAETEALGRGEGGEGAAAAPPAAAAAAAGAAGAEAAPPPAPPAAGDAKKRQRTGTGGITIPRLTRDPYLHFNRGQVLSYLEEYNLALASFAIASCDPTLDTKTSISTIVRHIEKVGDLVKRRALLSDKEVKEIAGTLARPLSTQETNMVGGRRKVGVNDLVEGVNEGVYLPIRILTHVPKSTQPVCFVGMDGSEATAAVSMYAPFEKISKLGTRVSVVLLDPVWKRMKVEVPAGAQVGGGGGGDKGEGEVYYSVLYVSDKGFLANGSLIPKEGLFVKGTSTSSFTGK